MQKFEYDVMIMELGEERDHLDRMGEEGWELVAVIPHMEGSNRLYFKRCVDSNI